MIGFRPIDGSNTVRGRIVKARIAANGSSTPTLTAGKGLTVSRVSIGILRVTFTDPPGRLIGINPSIRTAASSPFRIIPGAYNSTNKTIDLFICMDGGLQWTKSAADGMASTATAETVIGCTPYGLPVGTKFALVPAAALTANDTNFANINIAKRTAGGAATTIATFQTTITGGTGNWTQWSPVTVDSTVAAAAADAITVAITKTAGGVVVPAAVINLFALQDMPAATDNEISFDAFFSASDQDL